VRKRSVATTMALFSALACSSPTASDRMVQHFTGTIDIFPNGGSGEFFDQRAAFTVSKPGPVDISVNITPMTDLKFGINVYPEGGNALLTTDPAPPPVLTGHWDGVSPGGYRIGFVIYSGGSRWSGLPFLVEAWNSPLRELSPTPRLGI
jgi:hypothetical protein